jgi:hypothetical protein
MAASRSKRKDFNFVVKFETVRNRSQIEWQKARHDYLGNSSGGFNAASSFYQPQGAIQRVLF